MMDLRDIKYCHIIQRDEQTSLYEELLQASIRWPMHNAHHINSEPFGK